jgi:hypothetical protein
MEQEIKKYFRKGLEDNLQLKDKVDNLRNKISFAQSIFEEEKRIALLELVKSTI